MADSPSPPLMWPRWCQGPTGSGKTTWLLEQLRGWATSEAATLAPGQSLLVFVANGDNRLRLTETLARYTQGTIPVVTTTPNGFIQDEITLFWPLLVPFLGPLPQFPVRLRPENEQELATRFWQDKLWDGSLRIEGWQDQQTVRRSLDFLQMAASATIPAEDLATLLPEGMPPGFAPEPVWKAVGEAIVAWRNWCLHHSLLTYGVMTELYWQHLLPQPIYQEKLLARYGGVWVDDLDEYPAVTERWLQVFIDRGCPVVIAWNPSGKVRLGVGADPDRLILLRDRCPVVVDLPPSPDNLAYAWADTVVDWATNPLALPEALDCFQSLQTTSRGELLRQTAEAVATAIEAGQVAPHEVAIVGPGLDAIARYTLAEILLQKGLPVASLNDQRPLINSPLVRALLTLLTFVYPGLGRLADPDSVAEMLVVLSQTPQSPELAPWFETVQIDPVRAELLVDHCFVPRLDLPELLPVERFERWDRLGYRATQAYNRLRQWIAQQQEQRQQRLIPGVVGLLDRAIQTFYNGGHHLPTDHLVALRELVETAQHYWMVEDQLRQRGQRIQSATAAASPSAAERFIDLLRQGAVAANPYPADALAPTQRGITIATVFQYRLQRLRHRWHFWLDAGSVRWIMDTGLFGFPMFLSTYPGRPWRADELEAFQADHLERSLRDLLGRVTERVVLCHSDLSVTGQEQLGPLLPLINAHLSDRDGDAEPETPEL